MKSGSHPSLVAQSTVDGKRPLQVLLRFLVLSDILCKETHTDACQPDIPLAADLLGHRQFFKEIGARSWIVTTHPGAGTGIIEHVGQLDTCSKRPQRS